MESVSLTPEYMFRIGQKDLYELKYEYDNEVDFLSNYEALFKKSSEDKKILFEWLADTLPTIAITKLSPSEYSLGQKGPTFFVADFDEAYLAKFRATWVKAGSPWQVDIHSYDEWLSQISACQLLPTPLPIQQPVRWWDTPVGIIFLNEIDEDILPSRGDSWWLIQQQYPTLKDVSVDTYPAGEYFPKSDQGPGYILIDWLSSDIWDSDEYAEDQLKISKLRKALGIPELESIDIEFRDSW